MMYQVNFSGDFSKEFEKLKTKAEHDYESKYILDLINKGTSKLASDPRVGQKISKYRWPKEYIQKQGVNNLWKINLDNYWRLIYTLIGQEIKLVALVIEVLDHKKYDRKFGYKTT